MLIKEKRGSDVPACSSMPACTGEHASTRASEHAAANPCGMLLPDRWSLYEARQRVHRRRLTDQGRPGPDMEIPRAGWKRKVFSRHTPAAHWKVKLG